MLKKWWEVYSVKGLSLSTPNKLFIGELIVE
jgi:hypothetical protein